MRMILVLLVICMLPILVPISSATASPARAARTAFKGYELYSYEGNGTWHYVLLSGTNRIKSINEVASAPALTLPQLKERLRAMAVGETVLWSHASRVDEVDVPHPSMTPSPTQAAPGQNPGPGAAAYGL